MTLPELLNAVFTEDVVKFLASGVGAFVLYLLNKVRSERARRVADQLVDAAVAIAFNVVEDRAKQTPGKLDDKTAIGLQVLRDYLRTKGVELTDEQAERAKLLFESMHAYSFPSLHTIQAQVGDMSSSIAFNSAPAPVDAGKGALLGRKVNGG
jgi:hypothetical protein